MKLKQVVITIEGVTPLLMNRFTDEQAAKAESGTAMAVVGDRGGPREQAGLKVYLDSKGSPVIPGPNFFSCIMQAGIYHKVGKKQVTTGRSSLVPAGIAVMDIEAPVLNAEGNCAVWEVDSRPIVNPATKGRRLCHRPKFYDWRITFILNVDAAMFDLKFVRQLIDDAGMRVGLGDFRPDRKGPFGKFKVIRWDVSDVLAMAA